jgi:hypothetical protein
MRFTQTHSRIIPYWAKCNIITGSKLHSYQNDVLTDNCEQIRKLLLLFATKWVTIQWRYVIRLKKGQQNEQLLTGIWNFILSLTSHDRQEPVSSQVQSPATLWERRNRSRLTTICRRVSDSSGIRDILHTNSFLFFTSGITIHTIKKKRLNVRLRYFFLHVFIRNTSIPSQHGSVRRLSIVTRRNSEYSLRLKKVYQPFVQP